MSRLKTLLQELCPHGIKTMKLGAVLTLKSGCDYKRLGQGSIPVYGSGGVIAYVDSAAYDQPSVLIPRKGTLRNLFYVAEPFWTVDTIFYTVINTELVVPKYVFYCLQAQHLERFNLAEGKPALTMSTLNQIDILVPPLVVQQEIVRVLDSLSEVSSRLIKELTIERDLLHQQHNYYRDAFLTFREEEPCEFMTVKQVIVSLKTGINPRRYFKLNDGGQCFYITGKDISNNVVEVSEPADLISLEVVELINRRACLSDKDVLFVGYGPVGRMAVIEHYDGTWAISEALYCLKPKLELIDPYYLLFALSSSKAKEQFEPKISQAAAPRLNVKDLLGVRIPLPSLKEQGRIVSCLRRLDLVYQELEQSLEAEMGNRSQQYEYYRNKVLNGSSLYC